MTRLEKCLAWCLAVYLLFVGVGALSFLIINFPHEQWDATTPVIPPTHQKDTAPRPHSDRSDPSQLLSGTLDSPRRLLLIALLAGIVGSFLHASQSLTSYVGNGAFRASWTMWFVLRPWIGGLLGFGIYFALRAGLLAGAGTANPYGVVAIGFLGGWFSKITTDKLQEVFETLFKTDEDKKRKDKLGDPPRPREGRDAIP